VDKDVRTLEHEDAHACIDIIEKCAAQWRDPGPSFDTSAYLDANADVRAAGINPLEHWLLFGEAEGRAITLA
jgi:hypothetical protein